MVQDANLLTLAFCRPTQPAQKTEMNLCPFIVDVLPLASARIQGSVPSGSFCVKSVTPRVEKSQQGNLAAASATGQYRIDQGDSTPPVLRGSSLVGGCCLTERCIGTPPFGCCTMPYLSGSNL
mmetsp:Transcript_26521/g.73222  ORF Transcript_26521/g.73222 Transcript_26521/m.73222 type:complete len:123 (+) Transcript_26521:131-499(+)